MGGDVRRRRRSPACTGDGEIELKVSNRDEIEARSKRLGVLPCGEACELDPLVDGVSPRRIPARTQDELAASGHNKLGQRSARAWKKNGGTDVRSEPFMGHTPWLAEQGMGSTRVRVRLRSDSVSVLRTHRAGREKGKRKG